MASLDKGRRDFMRTTALLGAVAAVPSALGAGAAQAQAQATPQPVAPPSGIVTDPAVITQRRTLGSGSASMEVSALGFGVMGMNHDRGVHPDRKAMLTLLQQAADRGVTLFDTAEIYGPFTNEELAGEGLRSYRGKVLITTKFGFRIVDGHPVPGELDSRPENIRSVVDSSLKRLKVDTIEMLYQHRVDPNVPIEDVAGTVGDLIRAGKVKRFGLCEASAQTIRKAHAVQPVTAVQSEYHIMWREPEAEVFPALEELGIGFVPYSPINRGFLTGDINEYTRFDLGNDNRKDLPRFKPEAIRANLVIVEALSSFGRTRGATAAQVAMAWMMAKKPWIVPIPGTTKLAHLEENLRTADLAIPPEDLLQLENTIARMKIVGDRYPPQQQKLVDN